ncbi:MAG: signal peptidase I [Proteobacteria bacterium]|jgi:signal peptidase I|nr:signal peptidase I [Pseudomonadota bacterium]
MEQDKQTEGVVAEVSDTPIQNKPSKMEKFKKEAKSFTFIILSVLIFRSVLFEPFKIPSGSMIPTLLIGDFILVNKFSYGFKVPFSDWFSDPTYITGPGKPERGDVVVFKYPQEVSLNYIKRVVGLPGDTIEIIEKVVYVNGQPIEMKEIEGTKILSDMDEKYKRYNFKFFETKTGNHTHVAQVDQDNIFNANFYKITVPQNHYFVMGDNRDFSADSRSWGFVPFGHIKGKAFLIWFSLSFPWPWGGDEQENFAFRPWRIGKLID